MELTIRQNVALKNYTTYRLGGPALYFSEARTGEEIVGLREFAKQKKVPWMVLGLGSNLLFLDQGFPGLVIYNQMLKMHFQGPMVTVEGGVPLSQWIHTAAKFNLGGIEALIGIPGTVGGAIYGNAGVPGFEIRDRLMSAMILPENNNYPVIVQPDYFQFGYRESILKKKPDILLAATFKLDPQPQIQTQQRVNEILKNRILKQPSGASCGSFFKNPQQFPSAGWLIEQAGCKGLQMGGAIVSTKHGNWILNMNEAKSSDVLHLAQKIYDMVWKKFDTALEPEVQIIGNSQWQKAKK